MSRNYTSLNPENAYIWRIIHVENVPWILENGLHCSNSSVKSATWVNIGNEDLIDRRSHREVPLPPGGTLSDYVPFYFTPFSPMMYNIHTGRGVMQRRNEEIVIFVSTLHRVQQFGRQFVFTNQHAYPLMTEYYNDLRQLDRIDWPLLRSRNFSRNPDDPLQIERYQAEALVYQHLPVNVLSGVVCYTDAIKSNIDNAANQRGVTIDVKAIPGWYF
ncbi:MAG: DUF4433 domain-containing protein [Candidatus Thiodiazotropha weberae]|nr:DUF4433 domain-containing protein [Candidatus Thiodiazotropha weberae]